MNFGNKMMAVRKENNLSREQLAKRIGTSGAIVGRYERGDMKPSIEIAAKIAEALGVTVDYLLDRERFGKYDMEVISRLEGMQKLDEGTRSKLFDIIDTYIRDATARTAYAK